MLRDCAMASYPLQTHLIAINGFNPVWEVPIWKHAPGTVKIVCKYIKDDKLYLIINVKF